MPDMDKRHPTSDPYAFERLRVLKEFQPFCQGGGAGLFVALSTRAPSDSMHDALTKSAAALRWGSDGITFISRNGTDGDSLTDDALYQLIEGFDPICLVICDTESAAACASAYHLSSPIDPRYRLAGRCVRVFDDLEAQLETEHGRESVWGELKTLPQFPF